MKIVITVPDGIAESVFSKLSEGQVKALVSAFFTGIVVASQQKESAGWKELVKQIATQVAFSVELLKD